MVALPLVMPPTAIGFLVLRLLASDGLATQTDADGVLAFSLGDGVALGLGSGLECGLLLFGLLASGIQKSLHVSLERGPPRL